MKVNYDKLKRLSPQEQVNARLIAAARAANEQVWGYVTPEGGSGVST